MKRATSIIGPGLLVAATGIGAGDLATASFAGSHLGTAVLWAALAGAFLKFVANEGLARWQLATGTTLLEGVVRHFGRLTGWFFLAYLVFWTFFVASALMSACGVTLQKIKCACLGIKNRKIATTNTNLTKMSFNIYSEPT